MNEDDRNLNLLATFHFVVAAILAVSGLIPIIHLIFGIVIALGTFEQNGGNGPPAWSGFFFIGIALFAILVSWLMAFAVALAGGRLRERTHYTYCLVVAGIECMFMPFGTLLGVFTIVVLTRPTVKAMFGEPV